MEFRKYEKIIRLGKEEVDGILSGTVHVTEKIDGANLSVWTGDDSRIHVGSRNNDLTLNGNLFNGAVEYINAHEGIAKYLSEVPQMRLYGEWLVKHTIDYRPTTYKKFYLFDIWNEERGEFEEPKYVRDVAEAYSIPIVPNLGVFNNPTEEQLKELMGKSEFGDRGEGIVLRNINFVNQFGDKCYAKIVSEEFKEDNAVVFGGNNKFSDNYVEIYITNKYIDVARVQKIMNKVQAEVNEKLDLKHIPRIIHTVYHDMITEEAWEISQNHQIVKYWDLKRIATKKAKQVYIDILNNAISAADQK